MLMPAARKPYVIPARERDAYRDGFREAHAKKSKRPIIKRFSRFADINVSVTVIVTLTVNITPGGIYGSSKDFAGSFKKPGYLDR